MKKIIIFIILGIFLLPKAQTNIIPKIITPNLDASALGVFDKQSVNLSTGTPNIEVSIHTIHIGDMELPIKLKYDASGIKVNQMATSIGLGWSINNMGMVTQEVRDKIDGKSNNIIEQYINTTTIDGRNLILYKHQHLTQPFVGDDLETDIYNINYFGNTIPFFYNYNDNTYIPQQKDDTRITKNSNNWTVTLSDGTIFNFNEQYSSKSIIATTVNKANPQGVSPVNSPNLNDTWYLTNITNKGQTANLNYISSSNLYYSKGTENYESVSVIRNKEDFKLISEINTPFEKIFFEYSAERDDLNSNNGKADLLKFIKIYDNYGKLIKQFQLYYDYYNESLPIPIYASGVAGNNYKYKRLRLKEVKKLNIQTNIYENYYSFFYNTDTLPNRFSSSQDLWGYYNGKSNGEYMFSNIETKNIAIDQDYSGIGLLTKVKYPTGGFTEYFYENNKSMKPANYNLMIPEALEVIDKIKIFTKISTYYVGNGVYKFPFTIDSPMITSLFYNASMSNCPPPYYTAECDYTTTLEGSSESYLLNPTSGTSVSSTSITLAPGNYYILVKAKKPSLEDPDDYESPITFLGKIVWKEKKDGNEILVGGQRIKKIISNDSINDYTQEYSYINEDGTSSGSILTLPYVGTVGTYGFIYSQGANPLSKLKGQNLTYRRVEKTSKNINNSFNGKTVLYFTKPLPSNSSNVYPFPPPNDVSHTFGYLNKEEFFEFRNNTFNKIEENNYFYGYPNKCIENANNNCITLLKGLSYVDAVNIINTTSTINTNFDWGLYSIESSPYKLLSKKSTKFFNSHAVTTDQKIDYNSNSHNSITLQKSISPDGTTNITTYSYAHEKGNQLMIDKNMVGIPLEATTTQTIGGTTKTLNKTETIYPTSLPTSQTGNLVLPTSVLSYDLENPTSSTTEVTYDKYDSKGNIQQYTTKDGIPTVIIWGYNQTQPIAKVVGATYAQVSSLAAAIISASDTDASAAPNNDETAILTALDNFRKDSSMAGYQITTYTYDPLIGVRSITPPSGIREVYLYDTANRLMEIRENNQTGKLLKEFKYNYKN